MCVFSLVCTRPRRPLVVRARTSALPVVDRRHELASPCRSYVVLEVLSACVDGHRESESAPRADGVAHVAVYGVPLSDHNGVLPRRHSNAVWKAHVQDEAWQEGTAQRRARGDGRAWRHRHRLAHGVEANEVTGGAARLPVPA